MAPGDRYALLRHFVASKQLGIYHQKHNFQPLDHKRKS